MLVFGSLKMREKIRISFESKISHHLGLEKAIISTQLRLIDYLILLRWVFFPFFSKLRQCKTCDSKFSFLFFSSVFSTIHEKVTAENSVFLVVIPLTNSKTEK